MVHIRGGFRKKEGLEESWVGCLVLVGALVVANVLIQAFAIVLGCTDSKTSAQSMTATL